ncbi:blast:CDC42 small effector protein homolog [Drosophila guanche]|uniref:Blast:CDC42 small effector protein homolog n=1 Tax=Drosophila guanche TaxID=7266 RepID=A0A3B0KHF9_DROGU|nr:blast:CDC42 small effector protein homolog [Drosophila guanche]
MASTGEIWLQWFSCCFQQQRSPSRRPHQRLRIDRSMIGNPTNFVHTGHIGSADVELSANRLNAISTQMQGKGGYEATSIHSLHVSSRARVSESDLICQLLDLLRHVSYVFCS